MFVRSRNLTLETLMDSSNLSVLFYPEFSEQIIALAFKQEMLKLYKLLKKAESVLLPLDCQFEKENAIASLIECGEVELEQWLTDAMRSFRDWERYRDY